MGYYPKGNADTIVKTSYPQVAGGLNLNYDPNGNNTYPDLDRFGRVLQQFWTNNNGIVLDGYSYTYDAVGNVLSKQYIVAGGPTISDTYSYDSLDRLISTTLVTTLGGGGTTNYSLDALGNQYNVNAANEIQATAGINTPTYDLAGNMIGDGTYSYTYDAWGRLVQVNALSGGALVAAYSYDGDGRRMTKTLANGTATDFFYDQDWQIVEEQQTVSGQSGTAVTQYVWGLAYIDAPVVSYLKAAATGSTYVATYYTTDANHDVTATFATGGTINNRYLYGVYGQTAAYSGSWTNPGAPATSGPLYSGYFYDAETGNYLSRERFYSTVYSTWITTDPAQADPNTYRYCENMPTVATDPSGCAENIQVAGGGTIRIDGETMGTRLPHMQVGTIKIRIPANITANEVDQLATLPGVAENGLASLLKRCLKNSANRLSLQNQLRNARGKCGLLGVTLIIVFAAPEVAQAAQKGGVKGAVSAVGNIAVDTAKVTVKTTTVGMTTVLLSEAGGGLTVGGTAVTTVGGATAVGGLVTVAGGVGFAGGYGIGSIPIGRRTIHQHLGDGIYWVSAKVYDGGAAAWNWITDW